MWNYKLRNDGTLCELKNSGKEIAIQEEYIGPAVYIKKGAEETRVVLEKISGENVFAGSYVGLAVRLTLSSDKCFSIKLEIKNELGEDYNADSIVMRLGISHYMEKYPEWNDRLFPTLLRCEKKGFWGYFMSPNGEVLAIASADYVRSWSVCYNKVNADNYGHRIYTTDLVLFAKDKQPERHTSYYEVCKAGKIYSWEFLLESCANENEVPKVCAELSGLPLMQFEQYTAEPKSRIKGVVNGCNMAKISVIAPDGKSIFETIANGNFEFDLGKKIGLYTVVAQNANDENSKTEAKLYAKQDFSWYMQKARENAISKPQKATTHLESWYGFFSIFLADKHFPQNAEEMVAHKAHFENCFNAIYGGSPLVPLVEPERICNTAVAISLLVDAYEVYKDESYVDKAIVLADWMIKHQIADGSYRAYLFTFAFDEEVTSNGIHYTSVIYAMKSMLELVRLEEKLSATNAKCKDAYARHFESVKRAADNLVECRDNIDTEGEITFEDGMISCSSLQLGDFALYLQGKGEDASEYIEIAKLLFEKHKCLQQRVVPDCRRSCATLRFWEAQYDILLDKNMINSPHGWTSWKNYASYYLYLLTGDVQYLLDTMNCLGACMQMIDANSGELRWAFICDASVNTKVWHESENPEQPNKVPTTIGEQYMEMISGFWKVLDEKPVGAYPKMRLRIGEKVVESKNIGGCCDNDVHEHFKCMEEVVLRKAYIAEKENGEFVTFNCTAEKQGDEVVITPCESNVEKVHVNFKAKTKVVINFKNGTVKKEVSGLTWVE